MYKRIDSSFFRRRPLTEIFLLPQCGQRSGGLTGDWGGAAGCAAALLFASFAAVTVRLSMRAYSTSYGRSHGFVRFVKRPWRAGRGFAKKASTIAVRRDGSRTAADSQGGGDRPGGRVFASGGCEITGRGRTL